jgi:glycosyltransferase involved in cell wall biosynthesis
MNGISVVITTYHRTFFIQKLIENFLYYQRKPLPLEIIVVDDGGTDGLQSVLQKKYSGSDITYVRLNRRFREHHEKVDFSPSIPRNVGIKLAKYDVVGIFDPEIFPMTPNLLEIVSKMPGGYYFTPHLIRLPHSDERDTTTYNEFIAFFLSHCMNTDACEAKAIAGMSQYKNFGLTIFYNPMKDAYPPGGELGTYIGGANFMNRDEVIKLGAYQPKIAVGFGSDIDMWKRYHRAGKVFFPNEYWMLHFPHDDGGLIWNDEHLQQLAESQGYINDEHSMIPFYVPLESDDLVITI